LKKIKDAKLSLQKFKKFLLNKESDKCTVSLLTASDAHHEILSKGLGQTKEGKLYLQLF
jgi:hypothetical protein